MSMLSFKDITTKLVIGTILLVVHLLCVYISLRCDISMLSFRDIMTRLIVCMTLVRSTCVMCICI